MLLAIGRLQIEIRVDATKGLACCKLVLCLWLSLRIRRVKIGSGWVNDNFTTLFKEDFGKCLDGTIGVCNR